MRTSLARPKGAVGSAIGAVTECARKAGARAFLVGGPVRDMLLGNDALRDLDIAVEGDAEAVATALASGYAAKISRVSAFLTFKARFPDGTEVDVATSRRERYEQPGALPLVEPASIAEDLLRRDFSINALALELDSWSLVDPAGGTSDLERRLLRVLHDESFADDPTRILRGLRFEARLRLEWEAHTRSLRDEAIRRGMLGAISRERIWREIVNAAGDAPHPSASLLAIARSRALETIVGMAPAPSEAAALARADGENAWISDRGADPTAVRLALLFAGGTPSEEALQGAPLKRKVRELIISTARDPRSKLRGFFGSHDDGAWFDALCSMSCEELAIAGLLEPSIRPSIERFEAARNEGRRAASADRTLPPGPWIRVVAHATARAIFSRAITPGEAGIFARNAAVDYLRQQDRRE